jgi:hypothetical protein
MSLLNFKNPFSKKPSEPQDYLTLAIAPNKVIATVWNFQGENVHILSTAEKEFTNIDSIVHEAAIAIDNAAQISKTDVSKVVFGLSQYWFEEDKLKPEASRALKDLSSDLELDAQAFVTLAIAINHLLKVEQSITPQAILVGHFGDFCEVHLIKDNKVLESQTIKGEITSHKIISVIEQIKEKHGTLPSKIVVYGKNHDDITAKLTSTNWQEIFVHEPKIESFNDATLGRAIAFAQAADILGRDPELKPAKTQPPQVTQTLPSVSNLGFVEGEDILLMESAQKPPDKIIAEVKEEQIPQNLDSKDFAVDLYQDSNNLEMTRAMVEQPKAHHKKGFPKIPFSNPFKNISPKKLLIAIGGVIVLLVAGIFIAGQTLTSANVLIKLNSKSQAFDFTAKVVANSPDNFQNGEIAGQLVTGSAEGAQKAVATGSKKSGTKAKGQLIIQNWVKESKTFPAGTEVITKDGLKFTLDNEVQSASGTAHPPGEVKVGATAFDIGSKYNIGAGQDLSIVGFDEFFYSAKTDSAFTGGDEKQITVASAGDLTRLEKTLTNALTEKARADLESKTGGLKIYDESKIVKITKKQFDKKADDDAALINLNMSVDYQGIAFNETGLKKYLSELASSKIKSGNVALPETIDIKNVQVERNKDILTISGNYEAGIVSKLNVDNIKNQIAGKSVKDARNLVKSDGDVADVQITFSPAIPFVDNIPHNTSKINIKITTN